MKPANDRFWPMLLKKDFEGALRATLIPDQEQMRNLGSKNRLPGFGPFQFLIPQFLCGDFFNSICPTETLAARSRSESKCRKPNLTSFYSSWTATRQR